MEPTSNSSSNKNSQEESSTPHINNMEELLLQRDHDNTIIKGTDSDGRQYSSIADMWKAQGVSTSFPQQTKECWYNKAAEWYETHCPPTVDGVLGGFANISDMDLQGSRQFLLSLNQNWSQGAAAECGAGIGRVTKGLLLDLGVTHCDLIESSATLLYEAPEYIGEPAASQKCRFYHCGLQDWEPVPNRYSIIWIQWVLCYLTDEDVVAFLKRCAKGLLTDNGVIVLKENTCGDGNTFVVDNEDASICRSLPYWLTLVEAAGLRVIQQTLQSDFPDDLFPVPILALEPACPGGSSKDDHSSEANNTTTTDSLVDSANIDIQ